MSLLRSIALFGGFVAVGALFIWASLGRQVTDVGIRTRLPHNTPAGWVLGDSPPGQLFRSDFGGLERVEFQVIRQGADPGQGLVLEVRDLEGTDPEDFLDARVVRTAAWAPGDGTPMVHWASFRFDPIEGSEGRTYHLALRPAEGATHSVWSPFVRMRGSLGVYHQWGPRVSGDPIRVDFRPPPGGPGFVYSGGLWAIAIAFRSLHPESGETALDLYRLPRDGEEGEPELVSRGTLSRGAPITAGYGVFLLDPPCDLRLVPLRAELRIPDGAVVAGANGTPGLATYHGRGPAVGPGLMGQTIGSVRLPHRDLQFRAFGEDGVGRSWALLGKRGAQWRYVLGLLLWAATMTAATAFWKVAAARDDHSPRDQIKASGS